MKLIEIVVLFTILMLFISLVSHMCTYIVEYQSGSLHYMEKTREVLEKHGELLHVHKGDSSES